jgi:hypothetical protein
MRRAEPICGVAVNETMIWLIEASSMRMETNVSGEQDA